jgi:hypothetical protein
MSGPRDKSEQKIPFPSWFWKENGFQNPIEGGLTVSHSKHKEIRRALECTQTQTDD